tara:strand:- start:13 stop:300 length:288 start_codon:yes stop_codon:yes gene_type:complete
MMHCNQLSEETLDKIKPQSDFLADKLTDLGLKVRRYNDCHYNYYLIASLLHWELCGLDNANLKPWIDQFPGLIDFANLYAKDNGLRHIKLEKDDQ